MYAFLPILNVKNSNCARCKRRMTALLLFLPCLLTRAQTSATEFFPEFDVYAHLNPKVRFVFQGVMKCDHRLHALYGWLVRRWQIPISDRYHQWPGFRFVQIENGGIFELDQRLQVKIYAGPYLGLSGFAALPRVLCLKDKSHFWISVSVNIEFGKELGRRCLSSSQQAWQKQEKRRNAPLAAGAIRIFDI